MAAPQGSSGRIRLSALRVAVTGRMGQVVTSLIERAPREIEVIALGRPELDLSQAESVVATLRSVHCDAIINAAAYTAVDRAENEPDLAMRINGDGAGYVAETAAELGIPLLHLSTDYVFDGNLDRPYHEHDPTGPTGAYGRSKLAGEQKIASLHANHAILRTAWVYSPFGTNFVKTMLNLGGTRDEIRVVADQIGNPTSALDIADALLAIVQRLRTDPAPELRGIFHMTGTGEATWADLAELVFAEAEKYGRKHVAVTRIGTTLYPTLARRPANSKLDNSKLRGAYNISLPRWHQSVAACVARLCKANDQ